MGGMLLSLVLGCFSLWVLGIWEGFNGEGL